MRNLLLAILSATVLVLMFQVHSQSVAIKGLQQATASPSAPSLELQEKCAKQAGSEFKQEGLEAAGIAEFTNHYSAKIGRCFVVTKNTGVTGNVLFVHRLLVDAYEGKVYGTYEWSNNTQGGKKYWEVPPSTCSITLASGEEKKCQSDDEWNNLVNIYMDAI